jgi:hypothetical protein
MWTNHRPWYGIVVCMSQDAAGDQDKPAPQPAPPPERPVRPPIRIPLEPDKVVKRDDPLKVEKRKKA